MIVRFKLTFLIFYPSCPPNVFGLIVKVLEKRLQLTVSRLKSVLCVQVQRCEATGSDMLKQSAFVDFGVRVSSFHFAASLMKRQYHLLLSVRLNASKFLTFSLVCNLSYFYDEIMQPSTG